LEPDQQTRRLTEVILFFLPSLLSAVNRRLAPQQEVLDEAVRTVVERDKQELQTKVMRVEVAAPMRVVEAVALALLEVLVLRQQPVTEGKVFIPALRGRTFNAQAAAAVGVT
jgi:hypothetical protein